MATLTILEDNKGGPWCLRVGLIRAEDLPESNVLSTTDLSQYPTLDLHSKKQQIQSLLKKMSTLNGMRNLT